MVPLSVTSSFTKRASAPSAFSFSTAAWPRAVIPRSHQHFDLLRAQPARDLEPNPLVRAADERDVTLKEFHVCHQSSVYTIRSV